MKGVQESLEPAVPVIDPLYIESATYSLSG